VIAEIWAYRQHVVCLGKKRVAAYLKKNRGRQHVIRPFKKIKLVPSMRV